MSTKRKGFMLFFSFTWIRFYFPHTRNSSLFLCLFCYFHRYFEEPLTITSRFWLISKSNPRDQEVKKATGAFQEARWYHTLSGFDSPSFLKVFHLCKVNWLHVLHNTDRSQVIFSILHHHPPPLTLRCFKFTSQSHSQNT